MGKLLSLLGVLVLLAGCVTTSGTTASGTGTITNTATFNITPMGFLPNPVGNGPAKYRSTDPGQAVLPSASAESSSGMSTSGSYNIIFNLRQGSSEQVPAGAVGINASVPAGAGGGVVPMGSPAPSYGYRGTK